MTLFGNHISQQWVGDVVVAQGGASVQLYSKALRKAYQKGNLSDCLGSHMIAKQIRVDLQHCHQESKYF